MRICIIGGGITGLTTALALLKSGIQTTVYEQAGELNEVGAGIWLQPNALKVLEWLGLADEIKRRGVELDLLKITDARLIPFRTLSSRSIPDTSHSGSVSIHRGRLQKILFDAVSGSTDIRLNKRYIQHTLRSGSVALKFQDGEDNTDLLLGADGINSTVRKVMFPESSLRNSAQVGWRGISNTKLPARFKNSGQEAWGKQIRFGFSPVAGNKVYWFAAANEEHLRMAEKEGHKSYLTGLYKEFDPFVCELISNTDAPDIHHTLLYDLKRLPRWHQGPVCLLGDAAHATTPNMGQGACQAIEDAYCIGSLLSHPGRDQQRIFENFQRIRRKKVDYVVSNSWRFGKMAHSTAGQPIMKFVFKITPEKLLRAQMNKLYTVDRHLFS